MGSSYAERSQVTARPGARRRRTRARQPCQAALKRLNVAARHATIGRSSRGAWRMAGHPVVQQALSNKTLKRYKFIMPSELKC